jgi:hypothetical protein
MTMTNALAGFNLAETVKRPVLAGRIPGTADKSKIEKAARAAAVNGRVAIDCSGIDVMSSSYFDAAVWPLWSIADFFPILTKVPPNVVDDIEIVLKANGGAIWCITRSEPRIVGALDPTLDRTVQEVVKRGEVSAGDLLDLDRAIGPTAWSNRLAALYNLRLLRRSKDGRRLNYVVAWKV